MFRIPNSRLRLPVARRDVYRLTLPPRQVVFLAECRWCRRRAGTPFSSCVVLCSLLVPPLRTVGHLAIPSIRLQTTGDAETPKRKRGRPRKCPVPAGSAAAAAAAADALVCSCQVSFILALRSLTYASHSRRHRRHRLHSLYDKPLHLCCRTLPPCLRRPVLLHLRQYVWCFFS